MKKDKTQEILAMLFQSNVDTFTELKARQRISQCIKEIKDEGNGFDELNYSVFVKDIKKKNWKSKDHFFKVFYKEIEYIKKEYGVTQKEVCFLLSLGQYLRWELNLIVDEEDIPMNQKEIIEKIDYSKKTVINYLSSLYEKKIIIPVKCGRDNYYIINPNIMFIGQKINNQVPKLFELIGYVKSTNSSRTNRRKSVEKRTKVR